MPALSNARHERFAQELAKGKSRSEAYVEAGYKPSRSAATRLAADVSICERLAEIQGRAAVRAEITVASITERLMRLSDKGEALGDASGIQAARAAAMDAAKLNGLVVDRSEIGKPGDFDRMSDDELERFIAGEVVDLGLRTSGAKATAH